MYVRIKEDKTLQQISSTEWVKEYLTKYVDEQGQAAPNPETGEIEMVETGRYIEKPITENIYEVANASKLKYPLSFYNYVVNDKKITLTDLTKQTQIMEIKHKLLRTDYQSIRDSARAVLGQLTEEELKDFKEREAERQKWRDEIDALKAV